MQLVDIFVLHEAVQAAPSDEQDRKALYEPDDPSEFVFILDGRYALWDNNAYVELFIHHGMGKWESLTDGQWESLPSQVRAEYMRKTGSGVYPAPGGAMKDIVRNWNKN